MKCGVQVAAGVAGGYLLGRSKRKKWALLLGAAAGSRKLAGSPSGLIEQGMKTLGASPELSKLVNDDVRGRLVDAGKAAAVRVASNQMNALTDRVESYTDTLSQRAQDVGSTGAPRAESGSQQKQPADDEQQAGDERSVDEAPAEEEQQPAAAEGPAEQEARGPRRAPREQATRQPRRSTASGAQGRSAGRPRRR